MVAEAGRGGIGHSAGRTRILRNERRPQSLGAAAALPGRTRYLTSLPMYVLLQVPCGQLLDPQLPSRVSPVALQLAWNR